MCGFSGVAFANHQVKECYAPGIEGFRASAGRVSHRGDTDHNELLLDRAWLSHYRLAFQDIALGRQPMLSADGRHVIVFNGEVYNHLDLRRRITDVAGTRFRTNSDTETLIEGWKAMGERYFSLLEGEYAFVIVSTDGAELIAHRDRFGVKPLYIHGNGLSTQPFSIFRDRYEFGCMYVEVSSEIKGLASPKRWNRDGLLRQFVGLFEPIRTPFDSVIQVPPGGVLRCASHAGAYTCSLTTSAAPVRQHRNGTRDVTEEDFVATMHASVADRLLSDVELGVYLSGGVDSKVVAFELSRMMPVGRPMKSFTVGFSQEGYDETAEALRFARHFGFDPYILRVDDAALDYSYPLAIQASELVQPYTNGAAKWWLSLFARQYVNGVLTGDGADELLCGYPSYRYASWWKFVMRARGAGRTNDTVLTRLDERPLGGSRRDRLYLSRFATHAKNPWLAGSSAAGTGQDFVDSLRLLNVPHPLFGQIRTITGVLLGQTGADEWLREQSPSVRSWMYAGLDSVSGDMENPANALLLWQNYFAKAHLPTLILNWVGDRMEMANTLEGRTPYLSERMRELIAAAPDRLMVSGLRDKVLLRRAYAPRLTAGFMLTPKKQFNAPFLNSEKLISEFDAEDILQECALSDGLSLTMIDGLAKEAGEADAYRASHLQSVHQTAIAMSIVNRTIVRNEAVQRDTDTEARYLLRGGGAG